MRSAPLVVLCEFTGITQKVAVHLRCCKCARRFHQLVSKTYKLNATHDKHRAVEANREALLKEAELLEDSNVLCRRCKREQDPK